MGLRTVWLGNIDLTDLGFATHWAVKVGNECGYWFEIDGTGEGENDVKLDGNGVKLNGNGVKNSINGGYPGEPYWGRNCKKFEEGKRVFQQIYIVGNTVMSNDEINDFNKKYLRKHPRYDLLTDNCQVYALDLIQFVTEGAYKLPPMEAGLDEWADGITAYATASDGYASTRVSYGKAGAQAGIARFEAEGPATGADAFFGKHGVGAMGELSLGRAEIGVGKYAKVTVEPNLNTGISLRRGEASVKFLGLGISKKRMGLEFNTPLGTIGLPFP